MYGFNKLFGIPSNMSPWGMRLDNYAPTPYGEYCLVKAEPATIETHHQVIVLDENGDPLPGAWVIFGFPGGGPSINLQPSVNFWIDSPKILMGNAVRTDQSGYAQHTLGEGGEDIWIWDLNNAGELRYSSAIVRNCKWVQAQFVHTGVRLTFQRRDAAIKPEADRKAELDQRIANLEQMVQTLTAQIDRLEKNVDLITPGSLRDFGN